MLDLCWYLANSGSIFNSICYLHLNKSIIAKVVNWRQREKPVLPGPTNILPLGDIADEESTVSDVIVSLLPKFPVLPTFPVGKEASS
mmetsp:Transcript_17405/g.28474  ORF Transcript_17405/g.28474 Transcript_17405/m.28474 type:complete len:87 (-) Transcript_17405:1351-1611(-)